MIAKLRRMQFGRKSEKLDHQIEQLELQLGDLQAAEAKREMTAMDRAPRAKSARKPLPEHLPRDEQIQALPTDSCPDCGGGLRHLGEDVAEQSEFVRQLARDSPRAPEAGLHPVATRSFRRQR